jgi:glutamate-1-semialdehyde 2,1-aminomutase
MTFRISPGGAQQFYGVEPDLTTFGKIIGGGLPIGAFGGREDVMSLFDGTKGTPIIRQSGTFSGNPLTMAAGISVLKQLTQDAYDHLNSLGDFLRKGLKTSIDKLGIEGQITGLASLFSIHFTSQRVIDFRTAASSDKALTRVFHLSFMNHGIFLTSRGFGCTSLPMNKDDIQELIDKFEIIVQEIF